MQVKLDADWRALEGKEKAERERAEKAAAASPPPRATPINQALSLPDSVDAAHDLIARQGAEIQRLTHRVASLERLIGKPH
jgi:hypothetical protein